VQTTPVQTTPVQITRRFTTTGPLPVPEKTLADWVLIFTVVAVVVAAVLVTLVCRLRRKNG
jgi:hypothetical protein